MGSFSEKWNVGYKMEDKGTSLVRQLLSDEDTQYVENIRYKLNICSKDYFICVGLNEPVVLSEVMNCVDVGVGIAFSEEELDLAVEAYPRLSKTKIYFEQKVLGPAFDKIYCNYSNKKHLEDCMKLLVNNGLLLITDLPTKTCMNDFLKAKTKNKIITNSWFFPNYKNNKRFDLLIKVKQGSK